MRYPGRERPGDAGRDRRLPVAGECRADGEDAGRGRSVSTVARMTVNGLLVCADFMLRRHRSDERTAVELLDRFAAAKPLIDQLETEGQCKGEDREGEHRSDRDQ